MAPSGAKLSGIWTGFYPPRGRADNALLVVERLGTPRGRTPLTLVEATEQPGYAPPADRARLCPARHPVAIRHFCAVCAEVSPCPNFIAEERARSPAPSRAVNATARTCASRDGAAQPGRAHPLRAPELAQDALISRRSWPAIAASTWRTCSGPRAAISREIERKVAKASPRTRRWPRTSSRNTRKSARLGERLSDHLASFGGSWMFIVGFWRRARHLDRLQCRCGRLARVRSLPVHPAQPDPVLPRRDPGADHHDEPEAAGGEGPPARRSTTTRSTSRPSSRSGICTRRSIT